LTLSQKRSLAGRAGGNATLDIYGLNHFRQIGHDGGLVGGRPRNLFLSELRALVNKATKEGRLQHSENGFMTNMVPG
jgi:hypothetical protein